ncbi:MAG: hypothetical protein KJ002_10525 [Candidatus Dadabacteria bacterium]|nr:hypothetical protein [Candidatus Dadabacteria bacterium]
MEIKESLKLPRGISDSLRVLIKIVEAVHESSDLKEIRRLTWSSSSTR